MRHRVVFGAVITSFVAVGMLAACGDDDDNAGTGSTPDSGPLGTETGTPSTEAGIEEDAGSDAEPPGPNAIVPRTTTRIHNAINPYGLLFASDGMLYASGATMDGATRKLAVWRFKDDGTPDDTFGTGGVVTTDAFVDAVSSYDLVEVSAGNFVVQAVTTLPGQNVGKVWLLKLTRDVGGAWSFGAPVFVKFGYEEGEGWPVGTPSPPALPPSYASWGIGLDKSAPATPKIVVFAHGAPAKAAEAANQRVRHDRWITRVDASTLAFDTSFNGGKPYTVDADEKNLEDNARRGLVLPDGSIVSSGYTNFTPDGNHVVLIRLKPNGTVDEGFGFGTSIPGQTKFNPFLPAKGFAEAYNVVRQTSGSYVTTGYGTSHFDVPSKAVDLVTFRVKADGLDTSYGRQGAFAWQSELDKGAGLGANAYMDRGRDLAVLPDDRIVHVGVYDDYASVMVTDKDGKPDPSTGVNGLIEYSYPAAFFKVAVSPNKQKIAATAQSTPIPTDAGAPLASVLVTLDVTP